MYIKHNIWGLSGNLKRICGEKGIKPYSLVKKGVKEGTIDSIMKGSMPAADALLEVAKVLNITIEELLTGEKPQKVGIESGLSTIEIEYLNKIKAILKSGNDLAINIIESTIDTVYRQIEAAKKTEALAG